MDTSSVTNQTRLSKQQIQLQLGQQQQQQQQQYHNLNQNHNKWHQQQQHELFYPLSSATPPPNYQSCSSFQQSPVCYPKPRKGNKKHSHPVSDSHNVGMCEDYENLQFRDGSPSYQQVSYAHTECRRWNRHNIAATMERYDPSQLPHTPPPRPSVFHTMKPPRSFHQSHQEISHSFNEYSDDFHDDYAYVYYEPGAPMRHQNVPCQFGRPGPSHTPPPNSSIRALLSTARKNNLQRNNGNSLRSNNKNQNNFYEEISNDEIILKTGVSVISLNNMLVEEEFRRVHHRHERVLGELNLAVEEMLMPSTTNSISNSASASSDSSSSTPTIVAKKEEDETSDDFMNNHLELTPTNEMTSSGSNSSHNNNSNNVIVSSEVDSGFSGSHSSYIGNLRYQKTLKSMLKLSPITKQKQISNNNNSFCCQTVNNNSNLDANADTGMISLSVASRSSTSLYDNRKIDRAQIHSAPSSAKKSTTFITQLLKFNQTSSATPSDAKCNKIGFWKSKAWRKIPGFSSTSNINKLESNDEQKPISWEDPLPQIARSNSVSSATNNFNPQSIIRKSSNSIITLPNRLHHNSYTLSNLNNNQETSFYNSQPQQFDLEEKEDLIANSNQIKNILNNNLIIQNHNNSPTIKHHKKLEHTPSARTVSSEDSWCSSIGDKCNNLDDHDCCADDASSFNDDDDNISERSNSLASTPRNSQLRLTFNKAKQHLSFDKWRNHHNSTNNSNNSSLNNIGNATMPSTTTTASTNSNQESPGEPLSRLSRWFSIRRGSHQYDLNGSNNSGRSGSVEKSFDNDDKNSSGKKMPQLQETEEDHHINDYSQVDGNCPQQLPGARMDRKIPSLSLPPPPNNLTQQQLKRRHIIAAIVHSENSYVATLQRLVNDYKKELEESVPPILNANKIGILFHKLPDILQCHILFRIALQDSIKNWDRDEKIGDVFVGSFSKSTVLEVYSGFINNFSNAMELAKMEAKRKSALADFFKVKQISAHDRLSFFGLMVKPVQRFPQFILFLQDLLKHTPQGHHDRMSLQLALTQLESLAELLNERKREAEQYQAYKEMISQISGPFNTRFLNSSSSATSDRHCYLLREDNVTQLEFNQSGNLLKAKQRRLLLLNDRVICVSVAPKQSQDFGSTEKFSLKWTYPVHDVEIVDNTTSATLNRFITSGGLNRGNSLKGYNSDASNSNPNPAALLTNGAENLANEMSNLMYDYEIMSRINDLVRQLKGEYDEMNLDVTRNVLNNIQTSIKKKDEEMTLVDSCCLQIVAKQKGKEETYTFRTDNPYIKKEWITELRLAQLSLDPNNSPAWEISEREHQRPITKLPLFVRMHPVHKTTQHQTEVRCGCYYSMTNDNKFRKATKNKYLLWVCSVEGTSSHISIMLHQPHQQSNAMIKDVTQFTLTETVITSMDFVKGKIACEEFLDTDCVWVGTSSKKIVIYSATNPEFEKVLAEVNVPSVPTHIVWHNENVFVALATGNILMFRKTDKDAWNLQTYKELTLDTTKGISSMLSINSNIYAASGRKVFVLNGSTGDYQKQFEVQHTNEVNLMAHAGIGLWISLKNSGIICLYHTETFKHLQDINIASNVLRVTSSQRENVNSNHNSSSVYVTAMMAGKGLLWVGTNVGIALTVPLPRLEGVPIISGGVNISCHAHFGPVTFFLPLITKSAAAAAHQIQQMMGSSNNKKKDDANNNNVMPTEKIQETNDIPNGETNGHVRKIEKQQSLDVPSSVTSSPSNSASPNRLKTSIPGSPVVIRRRSHGISRIDYDTSRMSKTLPRSNNFYNTSSIHSTSSSNSSNNGSEGCDVYGLYSDLLFVKEDIDGISSPGNLTLMMDISRRSDPDIAALPAKVSTLDRRLKMKVSRPRSLDLSNWSVESRSSSLYTSSGSEESVGIKHYRSVSRNSSNASHKFNGTELMHIHEYDHPTTNDSAPNSNQLPKETKEQKESTPIPDRKEVQPENPPVNNYATTLKKRKAAKNNYHHQLVDGRRTVLMLMGGRGYINWRPIWSNSPTIHSSGSATLPGSQLSNNVDKQAAYHLRSNSMTINHKLPNSTDAHIIIWEKKL